LVFDASRRFQRDGKSHGHVREREKHDEASIEGLPVKRSRGRGRNRPQGGGGGGGGGGHNNHNRSFDSAGPDIKIRGTAAHVYEKYLQLARDANTSGDRVTAENYLQHAEHYYRIMMANQPQGGQIQQGQQGQPGQQPNGNGEVRPPQHNGEGGQPYAPAPGGSGPSFGFADEGDEGDDQDGNLAR
jgi:hypothetical protein